MDKSTTFICNSQSDKPLSEGLSHQMEEWTMEQSYIIIFACLFIHLFIYSMIVYYIFNIITMSCDNLNMGSFPLKGT